MKFIFKNFKNFYSNFINILFTHFHTIYTDLDPVKNGNIYYFSRDQLLNRAQHKKLLDKKADYHNNNRFVYLFPLLTMLYIVISDLLYILFFQYKNNVSLMEIPDLFSHRISPPQLWCQTDTIFVIAYCMTLSIYFCLLFTSPLEYRWLMFLFVDSKGKNVEIIQNGRLLEQSEANRIYFLQSKMKIVLLYVVTIFSVQIGFFVFYNIFQTSAYVAQSVHNFFTLVVAIPFILYILFSNFILIYFFVLNSWYLRVKQKCTAKKLASFEEKKFIKTSETSFWDGFKKLNFKMSTFQMELVGRNRFWSKYLSITFSVYMAEICYLTYAFFFVSNKVDLISYVLPSMAANFVLILFYVTIQCSAIVNTSSTVHRQAMRMAVRRMSGVGHNKKEFKTLYHLFKLDLMAANDDEISSFTLVTGHQINSTMFQSVAMYTLMFFMIVFKDNENI